LFQPRLDGGTRRRSRAAGLLAGIIAAASAGIAAIPADAAANGWQLLRSPNPQGGRDEISMSHTADTARSDFELAGMMLRCGEHGADVVVVTLSPLPPRARPQVTISALGKEWRFAASVVPPGAELLLPADAAGLTSGVWQSARELSISVMLPERSFAGVIPIDGLNAALATLSTHCPAY
jgi:hypothetical protein